MIVEFLTIVVILLIPLLLPPPAALSVRLFWRRLLAFVCRGGGSLMILTAAILAVVLNLAFWSLFRFPHATQIDEFAYLFAAETFVQGRLTNETHPLHESLTGAREQGFLIHEPTWQSKFPPGNSLFLAVGMLCGDPRIGLLLSAGLAFGGLCWMLQAVFPLRWAATGTLLALLNWFLLVYFGNAMFNGYPAMFSGTLIFGALFRIVRQPRLRDGILFGTGAVLLALTRPLEGLFTCLPAAAVLCWQVIGWRVSSEHRQAALRKALLPAGMVVLAGLSWLGYYHYRITGSAFVMPYQVWLNQVGGQKFSELVYSDGVFETSLKSNGNSLPQAVLAVLKYRWQRVWVTLLTLLPPTFMVALLGVFRTRRDGVFWISTFTVLLVSGVVMMEQVNWYPSEYFAPIIGLLILLITSGCRGLQRLPFGRRKTGTTLACLLPMLLCLGFLEHARESVHVIGPMPEYVQRMAVIEQVLKEPGMHLVLVRYESRPDYNEDWVYNPPNVDEQLIVWAIELEETANQKLRTYYSDRTVWLFQPQLPQAQLTMLGDVASTRIGSDGNLQTAALPEDSQPELFTQSKE